MRQAVLSSGYVRRTSASDSCDTSSYAALAQTTTLQFVNSMADFCPDATSYYHYLGTWGTYAMVMKRPTTELDGKPESNPQGTNELLNTPQIKPDDHTNVVIECNLGERRSFRDPASQ